MKINIRNLKKAMSYGDAQAAANLARAYMYGNGVRKNENKAVEILKKFEGSNNEDINFGLGMAYFNGIGTKQDFTKALKHLLVSADHGNISAQRAAGFLYTGTADAGLKNLSKAVYWLNLASRGGDIYAAEYLNKIRVGDDILCNDTDNIITDESCDNKSKKRRINKTALSSSWCKNIEVADAIDNARYISCSKDHLAAIIAPDTQLKSPDEQFTIGSKVIALGNNEYGQCETSKWDDIISVHCGDKFTIGLNTNGRIVAAGILPKDIDLFMLCKYDDDFGTYDIGKWKDIKMVRRSINHTIGLKEDGTVISKGDNSAGQCDVGDWNDIEAIACAENVSIGLRKDGCVLATGDFAALVENLPRIKVTHRMKPFFIV